MKKPSKKKSEAILEAITFWNGCRSIVPDEDGSYHKPNQSYEAFAEKLKEAGWKNISDANCGSFKQCFSKNNIAVKFPRYSNSYSRNEIEREYEQWNQASSKFRKHLTRTYCLLDLVLIQDKVLIFCRDNKTKCNLLDIAKEFPIADHGHNHGHSKRGRVKFFDWVYNRTVDHLNDKNKRLYA